MSISEILRLPFKNQRLNCTDLLQQCAGREEPTFKIYIVLNHIGVSHIPLYSVFEESIN